MYQSGKVGGVETSTFYYDENSEMRITEVYNANNAPVGYTYDPKNGKLTQVSRSRTNNCPNAVSISKYSDDGATLTYKEDWKGNRTSYTYDSLN